MFQAPVTTPADVFRASMLAYRGQITFADDVEVFSGVEAKASKTIRIRISGPRMVVDANTPAGRSNRRFFLKTGDRFQTYEMDFRPKGPTLFQNSRTFPVTSALPKDAFDTRCEELLAFMLAAPNADRAQGKRKKLTLPADVIWDRKAPAKIDDRDCDVIGAQTEQLSYKFWLDQKSHLLRQMTVEPKPGSSQGPFDTSYNLQTPLRLHFHPTSGPRTVVANTDFRMPEMLRLPELDEAVPTKNAGAAYKAPQWSTAAEALGNLATAYESSLPLKDWVIGLEGERIEFNMDRNHAYRVRSVSADGNAVIVQWSDGRQARVWHMMRTKDSISLGESSVPSTKFDWGLVALTDYMGDAPVGVFDPNLPYVTAWPASLPHLQIYASANLPQDDVLNRYLFPGLRQGSLVPDRLDGAPVYRITQDYPGGVDRDGGWAQTYQLILDRSTGLIRQVGRSQEPGTIPHFETVDLHPRVRVNLKPSDLDFRPPVIDFSKVFS